MFHILSFILIFQSIDVENMSMSKQFFKLPYIICYLCAFVAGMKQLREPDIWWQLLSGRWMLDNGEITRSDMFSYTMEGTKWVNTKWLYEVLIAAVEKGLGPHGVMLLQAIVNVAIVYLLLRIVSMMTRHLGEQMSTLFSTVSVLFFLAISEFRMAGRPEMVSHLLTVVYIFILWRSQNYSWKYILWLIPLQCVWANMHDAYPVGIVLVGLYIGSGILCYLLSKSKEVLQATGRLALVLAGMMLVILINPYGVQMWKQPFEIFRQLNVNKYTTELFSIAEPEYWTLQAKAHIVLFAVVCLYWIWRIVINFRAGKRINFDHRLIGYLLSIPALGYLSLSANRNIPFAEIALLPTLPLIGVWLIKQLKLLSKPWYATIAKRTVFVSTLLAAVFYISIVSNAFYTSTDSPNRYGLHVSVLHNPTSTAEFIKTYNLKGPAFTDYFVSSYLLWSLYPDFKSYIDLRDLDIFSEKFFEEYFELDEHPEQFSELDSNYKFNYIVISTSKLKPLQMQLYWGEGFNVVHVDPVAVVMLRQVPENDEINYSPAARKLYVWPQDPIDPSWAEALSKVFNPNLSYDEESPERTAYYAAMYYNAMQNFRISLQFLLPAVKSNLAEDVDALVATGYAYMGAINFTKDREEQQQKMDSAGYYLQRALALNPDYPETHEALSGYAFQGGQYAMAKKHIDKYLTVNPNTDYMYFMRGLSVRNINKEKEEKSNYHSIISDMNECLRLNKKNTKAYLYLAEAYLEIGDMQKARTNIMKAIKANPGWLSSETKLLDELKEKIGVEKVESMKDLIK